MKVAKGIYIPVLADYVLSPDIFYNDNSTSICFKTHDEQFGRITFANLDSIKICRGENLPYDDDWKAGQKTIWVYKVENSDWLHERYHYEKNNYGDSYEFGGNVEEMLTEFMHYVFKFHDEFVEVIAKGFWFEKDEESLFKKALQDKHPFLPLTEDNLQLFETENIKYKVIFNKIEIEKLIENAQFCPQKLVEIAVEFKGKYSISLSLEINYRNGKLISKLKPYMGKPSFEKEGIATFEEIKPYVDEYIKEVAERRRQMYE